MMIKAARGKPLRINMAAYRVLCDIEVHLSGRSPWTAEELLLMRRQLDAVLTQAQHATLNNEQHRLLDHANRHGRYNTIR